MVMFLVGTLDYLISLLFEATTASTLVAAYFGYGLFAQMGYNLIRKVIELRQSEMQDSE